MNSEKGIYMQKVAILPAYNLEESIGEIVKRTSKFVDVVIVVSDGSKDKTHLKAEEAGAICPMPTNSRGKGLAVRRGIELSRSFDPAYIILMDSDGQHLPEEIPLLLEPLMNHKANVIVGSRMKGSLKTSKINKIGNFLLKTISFIITRKWFTDTESGFRAFEADKLYNLKLESISYEIESELLLKSLHNGLKVIEVPITAPKAVPGVTVSDGIKMGIYKIRTGLKLMLAR
jgi:glycosyltransferase involved in cell wall biosynthesis